MQHKKKKVVRKRGSETHGHGASKKHRGKGHRGGKGYSGGGKRGDFKIGKLRKLNKLPTGKSGFTSKSRKTIRAVNLDKLQKTLRTYLEKNLIDKKGDAYSIDLKKIGFDKLLSKGEVYTKMTITASQASLGAVDKVKQAGGEVILLGQKDNEENIKD
jgi:large subunit ribosomal protein L15